MFALLVLVGALIAPRNLAADVDDDGFAMPDEGIRESLSTESKPCSSEYFHREGKCGGALHGYLRCPKDYWCSQKGFCGTTPEHRLNSSCPREAREDPENIEFMSAPNDDDEEPLDDDMDDDDDDDDDDDEDTDIDEDDNDQDLSRNEPFPVEFCSSNLYHRWGKCGFPHHGYFRCPHGEWCSAFGYCGRSEKYRQNAICPRETRPDPSMIQYSPAPDDDPAYYGSLENATPSETIEDQVSSDAEGTSHIDREQPGHFYRQTLPNSNNTLPIPPQPPVSPETRPSPSPEYRNAGSAPQPDDEYNSRFTMDNEQVPMSQSSATRYPAADTCWLVILTILYLI